MADAGERWFLVLELPPDVPNAGRFVAKLLKHLLRTWNVRCRAVSEPEEVRRLQDLVEGLAARVDAQAELLAGRAEKGSTNGAAEPVQTSVPRDANGGPGPC
jgi:hypothetical protein